MEKLLKRNTVKLFTLGTATRKTPLAAAATR